MFIILRNVWTEKDELIYIFLSLQNKKLWKFNRCQKGYKCLKQAIHNSLRYVKGKFEKIFWISIWDVKDIRNILCSYICWKMTVSKMRACSFLMKSFQNNLKNWVLLAIPGYVFSQLYVLKGTDSIVTAPRFLNKF